MSIPTDFNPLGTPKESYITDGLVFWLDAGYEPKGTKDYITELTTGTRYHFDNGGTTTFNGKETVMERLNWRAVGFPDWFPESNENSVEMVGFTPNNQMQDSLLRVVPWKKIYSAQYDAYYPAPRLQTQEGKFGICFDDYYQSSGPQSKVYIIPASKLTSCYLELGEKPYRPYVNGVPTIQNDTSGSVGASIVDFYKGVILGAIRIYNRKLTPEERAHNLALDMKRFDFETIRG